MKQSEVKELSVAELQEELGKSRKIGEPNTVKICKEKYSEISYRVN